MHYRSQIAFWAWNDFITRYDDVFKEKLVDSVCNDSYDCEVDLGALYPRVKLAIRPYFFLYMCPTLLTFVEVKPIVECSQCKAFFAATRERLTWKELHSFVKEKILDAKEGFTIDANRREFLQGAITAAWRPIWTIQFQRSPRSQCEILLKQKCP